MTRAVLYVPPPDLHAGLLGPGPCGARPPQVIRGEIDGWTPARESWVHSGDGLVLAWDGASVPAGIDALARVLGAAEGLDLSYGYGFAQRFGDDGCWSLHEEMYSGGSDVTYYAPNHEMGELRGDHEVAALADIGVEDALAVPRALAAVSAARLGGEVVVLEKEP